MSQSNSSGEAQPKQKQSVMRSGSEFFYIGEVHVLRDEIALAGLGRAPNVRVWSAAQSFSRTLSTSWPREVSEARSDSGDYSEDMSTLTRTLIDEIKAAPETVQQEVFDFLVFLKTRQTAQANGQENLLPLAQTAWGADWNTPQEDEAWRDL